MIVPFYKGKGERTECKSYRGISFLSVGEKIYTGILIDEVRRATEGLTGKLRNMKIVTPFLMSNFF